MRFLKFIAYLFLIGFIIDLFYKFFDFDKFIDDSKAMGFKASATLVLFGIIVAIIEHFKGFEAGVNWFLYLIIPTLITAFYFTSSGPTKKELKS